MATITVALLVMAWGIHEATRWHWLACGLLAPIAYAVGLLAYVGVKMLDELIAKAL